MVQDYPEGISSNLVKLAYKIKYNDELDIKGKLRDVIAKPIPSQFVQMSTDRTGIMFLFPASISAADIVKAHAVRDAAQRAAQRQRAKVKKASTGELVDAETRDDIIELLRRTQTLYFNTLKDAFQLVFKRELLHEGTLHQVLDSIPCVKRQTLAPPAGTASEAVKREALLNPTILLSLRDGDGDDHGQEAAAGSSAAAVPIAPSDGFEGVIPDVAAFKCRRWGDKRYERILQLFLAFHQRSDNCEVALEWLDGDDSTSGVVVHGLIVAFQNDEAFARIEKRSLRTALMALCACERPLEVSMRPRISNPSKYPQDSSSPYANVCIVLFGHKATPIRLVDGSPLQSTTVPRITSLPDEHKSVVKLVHFKTPRLRLCERDRELLRALQGQKEQWRKVPVHLRGAGLQPGGEAEGHDGESEEDEEDEEEEEDDEERGERVF